MGKIFFIGAIFFVVSFIIPYFSANAIDYEKLLEEAQNHRKELIDKRLEADRNAAKFFNFKDKNPYIREAEGINKQLKAVMDKIALYKKAVANFDEVIDAGQSVANLGYSRKPYKGKIEDLENQIAKNQKDINDLEARLRTSPNDQVLKRAHEDLEEETFQLRESLREAKNILKNLNKEMRDKTDPERLAKMEAEKARFDRSKELQSQLDDAQSEMKKARLKGDKETVEGLRKFIRDTQADIDDSARLLYQQQLHEERAALSSPEGIFKKNEAKAKRALLVAKIRAGGAANQAAKKAGWFKRLTFGRSRVVLGLPIPDPLFDIAPFYIAQRAANKCHRAVTGQIKVGDSEMAKCVKLLLDQQNRRIASDFGGIDPLSVPGGDLYEIPEGYYKTQYFFIVPTKEKMDQYKRDQEKLRFN